MTTPRDNLDRILEETITTSFNRGAQMAQRLIVESARSMASKLSETEPQTGAAMQLFASMIENLNFALDAHALSPTPADTEGR